MLYDFDEQDKLWLQACKFCLDVRPTFSAQNVVEMLTLMEQNSNGLSPVAIGMWLKRTGAFKRIRGHSCNRWKPTRRFRILREEQLSRQWGSPATGIG